MSFFCKRQIFPKCKKPASHTSFTGGGGKPSISTRPKKVAEEAWPYLSENHVPLFLCTEKLLGKVNFLAAQILGLATPHSRFHI